MKEQIVSEFRKLTTTRTGLGLLAGLLAIVAFGSWAVAGRVAGPDLALPLHVQPFLVVAVGALPAFALILGIRSFTDEFRNGSIVPTILATPARGRVFGAKLVVGALAGAAFAVAALGVSAGTGAAVLAGSKGAAVTWSTAGMLSHVGRFALAGGLWTAIGVGVGAAIRHQVAAIVGSLVWLLVAESILLGVAPGIGRFLPGSAGAAALGLHVGTTTLGADAALVALAGWAIAAAATGSTLLRARDVT
jgi:ABC-2 type transport system permease protein